MTRALRVALLALAALLVMPASSLAANIAVLGNNQTDEVLAAAGNTVTLVTDAQVATPGFLDGFDVFVFTRNGIAFNPTLSAAAAAEVRAFTKRAVLLNGDFADGLSSDQEIKDLYASSVRWAGEHGGGYIGELEGATAGLASNGDGQPALNFLAGSATPSSFGGLTSTIIKTPAGETSPVLDGVSLPHSSSDVNFAAGITGASDPQVLARYQTNNSPAILAGEVKQVAVLGNNAVDDELNEEPGMVASLVSDAQVATAGFLDGFDAFLFTRNGIAFNPVLSAGAAAQVRAFTKRAVLLNGDFADGVASDPEIHDLFASSVRWAGEHGGGYVGELEGATAGLASNGDGQPALNFLAGSATASTFSGLTNSIAATPAGASHPALDDVALPHSSSDVNFMAQISGAPASKVLARYVSNNNPAILASDITLDARRMVTNTTVAGTTYASIVECNAETANTKARPFYLQWSDGGVQQFKVKGYRDVQCLDDSNVAGAPNGFDTQIGEADGAINGVSGYRVFWTIVDGGATASDRIDARIVRLSDGATIRTVSGTPAGGTGHTAMAPG